MRHGSHVDGSDEATAFVQRIRDQISQTPPGSTVVLPSFEGTDRTNIVSCALDRRYRVEDLYIAPDWWFTLGLGNIGAAILDAYVVARQKVQLANLVLLTVGDLPSPRPGAASDLPANTVTTLPVPGDPHFERAFVEEYAQCSGRIASLRRSMRQAHQDDQHWISGPARLLRARVVDRAVCEIQPNPMGIEQHDTAGLSVDARWILDQARNAHLN